MKKNENGNTTDLVNIRDLLPDNIPILPLVIRPLFPNILTPIAFTGKDFLETLQDAEDNYNGFVGLVFTREIDDENYFDSDLYEVGTVVKINKSHPYLQNLFKLLFLVLKDLKK